MKKKQTVDTALYFHIPFCRHRCAYCDFTTYAGQDALIPAYVDALCREIDFVGGGAPKEISAQTIFFGGGTPSLLSVAQFEAIFAAIRQNFALRPNAEISLEANPGTLSPDYLRGLRAVGFNRLSIGVQSAHPGELRMLERIHSYADVVAAALAARKAGFENLSFDLIYGLPEQTLERWQDTVQLILGLRPEHLSCYALTLEHGTPFGRWAERGLLPLPDPDLAADMYAWADAFLVENGYCQYEISNWAQPARECRHNLRYWRNLPYLGFGAGAHGYAAGTRYANVLRIQTYIKRLANKNADLRFPLSPAAVGRQKIDAEQAMREHMLMGLRLTDEGVSDETFRARFGRGLFDIFPAEIRQLMDYNLLEWAGDRLRLTSRARLLGNQVFIRFVGDS